MSPQGQLEVAEEPDRVCKALQNRIFSKDSREAESNQDIDHLIKQYKNSNLFEYVEPDFIGIGGGKKAELQYTLVHDLIKIQH